MSSPSLPRQTVPRRRAGSAPWPSPDEWPAVPAVPLQLSDGSGPPRDPTTVRLLTDPQALWVRFDCTDTDAWGTHAEHDAPLYEEEAVEVFLAPASDDGTPPRRYVEIEASPQGVLFDALIDNPTGDRHDAGFAVDVGWDLPGLAVGVETTGESDDWRAVLRIPWPGLLDAFDRTERPGLWRVNLYRIERPRDGRAPEFSAWSPTLADPPDFHRPGWFGWVEMTPRSVST